MAARGRGKGSGKMAALDFVGDVIEGAGEAIGGALQGAGAAIGGGLQGLGSAIGGALQGALTEGDKTIVNMGIVGEAGKQNVQEKPVVVPPVPAAEKNVSIKADENMPTKKLLSIVIKYLASIDNTLKASANFDAQLAKNEAAATREQTIESPSLGGESFGKIGDSVTKKEGSSATGDFISSLAKKFAIIAAGAGAFAILGMDEAQFDKLSENIAQFKNKYGWIVEIAAAGGMLLWLRKLGPLGALGFLAMGGVESEIQYDENGNPIGRSAPSLFSSALSLGFAGMGIMGMRKGIRMANIRGRAARIRNIRTAPRAAPSLRGSGFRDPVTGRAASRQAVTQGGGWLSSAKGQRFIAFLQRRFGATFIARRVMPFLARAFVTAGVTATGIGAIPGAILFLLNLGLSLSLVWDLGSAWWDFLDEEELRDDAEAVNQEAPDQNEQQKNDAESVGAPGVTQTRDSPGYTSNYTSSGDFRKDAKVTRIIDAGPGFTTVQYEDGTTERRTGTLASRNNNPGNIEYGPFARSQGAVGSDGRFAVFATPHDGFQAMRALLQDDERFGNLTVSQAITKWAPPSENDTAGYIAGIQSLGIDVNQKFSDLTPQQQDLMITGMAKKEGYYADGSGPQMAGGGAASEMMQMGKEALGAVVGGLRDFIRTDTTYDPNLGMGGNPIQVSQLQPADAAPDTPSASDNEKLSRLAREQVQADADQIAGLREQSDASRGQASVGASNVSAAETALRNANGGSLDVMNPNYKMEAGSLLSKFVMFLGTGTSATVGGVTP